jgi:hypothetical protein
MAVYEIRSKKWGLSISRRETLIKYASCIFNSISDWVNFARGEAIGYTWRCMKYDKKSGVCQSQDERL